MLMKHSMGLLSLVAASEESLREELGTSLL